MADWFERTIRRQPAPLPPDTTREGLLAAVLAAPDDDEPRWVAADWFGHLDDPRGEFIAVQLTLAGLADDDPRREELVARETALLGRHKPDWVGRFKGARTEYGIEGKQTFVKGNPTYWTFERGFVDTVKMAATDFISNAAELLTTEPVRTVQLTRVRGQLTRFLAECPELERVRALDLARNPVTEDDLTALFSTTRLASIEQLDLTLCRIGMRRGARVLESATARFPRLHTLMLWSNDLGDAGVSALANCAFMDSVRTLGLGYNKLGPRGAAALLESGSLSALTDLRVPGNLLEKEEGDRLIKHFCR